MFLQNHPGVYGPRSKLYISFFSSDTPVTLKSQRAVITLTPHTPFTTPHLVSHPFTPLPSLHPVNPTTTTRSEFFMLCLFSVNTLRPRQDGCLFPDDILKLIFLNQNVWISIRISLTFVPKGPINNIPALVQIMAWRRSGDKPLSETMMISLLTHICVTRPQWVKHLIHPIASIPPLCTPPP